MNEFWSRRTCVILTGASKGIGQSLAVEIGRLLIPESTIVLMARDTNGLEKTKELVNKVNGDILVEVCLSNTGILLLITLQLTLYYVFSITALICVTLTLQCLKKLSSLLIP